MANAAITLPVRIPLREKNSTTSYWGIGLNQSFVPVKQVVASMNDAHAKTGISAKDLKLLQNLYKNMRKKPSEVADNIYVAAFFEMVEKSAASQGIVLTGEQREAAVQDAADCCKRNLAMANEYHREGNKAAVRKGLIIAIGAIAGFGTACLARMGSAASVLVGAVLGLGGWMFSLTPYPLSGYRGERKEKHMYRDAELIGAAYAIKAAVIDAAQK